MFMSGLCSVKERMLDCGGKRIFSVEYIPSSVDACAGNTAVIMSHGYNSSCRDIERSARFLAESGIYCCSFDFCGGSTRSRSSGSSLQMSIESEISDLKDVIRTVMSENSIKRLYLYGESQGGYVSALTACELKGQTVGLFLLYPAFCIQDDWLKNGPKHTDETIDFMGMTVSQEFVRGIPRCDSYEKMSGYYRPALIFHGDSDRTVDLSYSERLAEAMPNSKLFVAGGEGHGFGGGTSYRVMKCISSFIKSGSAYAGTASY